MKKRKISWLEMLPWKSEKRLQTSCLRVVMMVGRYLCLETSVSSLFDFNCIWVLFNFNDSLWYYWCKELSQLINEVFLLVLMLKQVSPQACVFPPVLIHLVLKWYPLADGFHVTLYLFGNRSQMMYKCSKGIKVMQKAQLSLSVPLLTTWLWN